MGVAASYAGWYDIASKTRAEINYNPNTQQSQALTYKWAPVTTLTSAFIDLSLFAPKSAIGTTRTFSSFNEAGFEDAISRLYGGVHVREAIVDAVATGQAIANYVVKNIAQPV